MKRQKTKFTIAGEDHVSIVTDGRVSPTTLTPRSMENFRNDVRERKRLGIAAPYENETGYRFAGNLNTPCRFETLAGLMQDRGHSEGRIEKLLGANLLRVFSDTWAGG